MNNTVNQTNQANRQLPSVHVSNHCLCNYDNDYYGDQLCISGKSPEDIDFMGTDQNSFFYFLS